MGVNICITWRVRQRKAMSTHIRTFNLAYGYTYGSIGLYSLLFVSNYDTILLPNYSVPLLQPTVYEPDSLDPEYWSIYCPSYYNYASVFATCFFYTVTVRPHAKSKFVDKNYAVWTCSHMYCTCTVHVLYMFEHVRTCMNMFEHVRPSDKVNISRKIGYRLFFAYIVIVGQCVYYSLRNKENQPLFSLINICLSYFGISCLYGKIKVCIFLCFFIFLCQFVNFWSLIFAM